MQSTECASAIPALLRSRCGLHSCFCWGCFTEAYKEGLGVLKRQRMPPCAAAPPPTFKASKEPTITASRNFLSRLPLTYLLHSTSCKHTPPSLGAAAAARHRHMPTKLSAAESPSSSFQAPALTPPPSSHQPSLFTACHQRSFVGSTSCFLREPEWGCFLQ